MGVAWMAIPFGLLTGLLLGGVGGGGSILAVPVLVYVLGLAMPQASTTSLLVVGIVAAVGSIGHARAGTAQVRQGLMFGLLSAPAAWLGSWAGMQVPEGISLVLFGVLMVGVAAMMWRKRKPGAAVVASTGRMVVAASGVGLLTGFFGVGGGFLVVPALVLTLGLPMLQAVGTSLVVIAVSASMALVPRLAGGSFDLAVAVPFTLAGVVGALSGRKVASLLPEVAVRRFFALMIAVLGAVMVVQNV